MITETLTSKIQFIVMSAKNLVETHMEYRDLPVNYACIFAQNENEYSELTDAARDIVIKILKETPTGTLFQIQPLQTGSGILHILKIRKPDMTRPEIGDADFTIDDYEHLTNTYLKKAGYKLIQKDNFVMVELYDQKYNVRAYFSNPALDKQFGLI